MRVVDRLAQREATWQELDALVSRLGGLASRRARRGAKPARTEVVWLDESDFVADAPKAPRRRGRITYASDDVLRLGELYRAACADLMLAEAHDLPRDTVAYLHDLVARAHNVVYRSRGFDFRKWAADLLANVPRRLRADPTLRVSALVFYGSFLVFGLIGAARQDLAVKIVGESTLEQYEQMYADPHHRGVTEGSVMTGFYIQHNASIGLSCFAWGLTFCVMTLFILFSNGMQLGVIFGHMALTPQRDNFYTFVTAHAPFELTAIVFSGAAGLRLGWGLIETRGQTRLASLRREAKLALPTVGTAVFLFVLAAFLEGFVSPSSQPYYVKGGIALTCAAILLAYVMLGGRGPKVPAVSTPTAT